MVFFYLSVTIPDQTSTNSLLFAGSFIARSVSFRIAFPFTRAFLVLCLPVQEPEALVAEAGVATEPGELDCEFDDLRRLQLRDVQRRVEHAELEAAVVAHVGAAAFRVNVERGCLFRDNHWPEKKRKLFYKAARSSLKTFYVPLKGMLNYFVVLHQFWILQKQYPFTMKINIGE